MLESIFLTILRMSIQAAVVIPAVLLLRLALKKAPKVYVYSLWLLVLLRLLCPVFPEFRFSQVPEVSDPVSYVEQYTAQTPVFAIPEAVEEPAPPYGAVLEGDENLRKATVSLQTVLADVWLLGTLLVLAWGYVSLIPLKRKLKTAVPVEKGVYLADHMDTPFVMGVIRPKIYLPSDLPEDWKVAILLHERCHIRQLDPLVKHLYFLALAVHWFNPLVWVAYWLLGRDMEMRCDEAVMRNMEEDARRDYAQSLLCLSTGRRSIAAPLAFGEGDTGSRIKNILNYRKPAFWLSIAGAALCILAAVFLLTNPAGSEVIMPVEDLSFPGVPWMSSPEEVKELLDIGPEDIVAEEWLTEPREDCADNFGYYIFAVRNREVFGQQAKMVVFRFYDETWTMDALKLAHVVIYYPDAQEEYTADLDALKTTLVEQYGPSAEETVSHTWFPGMSSIGEQRKKIGESSLGIWYSEHTGPDALTPQQQKTIYEYMVVNPSIEADSTYWLPGQEEYMSTVFGFPLVQMHLRDVYFGDLIQLDEQIRANGLSDYVLELNAMGWMNVYGYLNWAEN